MSYKAESDAMPEDAQSLLPLTPTVFHMLLALADGDKHGYGIMKAVEDETQGQMQIRTGSQRPYLNRTRPKTGACLPGRGS